MPRPNTKRPSRRTLIVADDDHAALKGLANLTAPLPAPLIVVISAARLALESLSREDQVRYIHQAATTFAQHNAAG